MLLSCKQIKNTVFGGVLSDKLYVALLVINHGIDSSWIAGRGAALTLELESAETEHQ